MSEIYIDATDHILGRLSSYVTKLALEGNNIYILNAEKIVITGKKRNIIEFYKHRAFERGDWYKGPFYPRKPDRILRRTIEGMLPKNSIGKEALNRIKIYIGIPDEFKDKKLEKIENAMINRINRNRKIWYIYLEELSRELGAKF